MFCFGVHHMASLVTSFRRRFDFPEPLQLQSGATIHDYHLMAYETYGTLNADAERHPGLPRAQRLAPCRRHLRRARSAAKAGGTT